MKPRKKSSQTGNCQIVINMEAPEKCRIGLLENGRLEAFDIETFSHTQTRGGELTWSLTLVHLLLLEFVQ